MHTTNVATEAQPMNKENHLPDRSTAQESTIAVDVNFCTPNDTATVVEEANNVSHDTNEQDPNYMQIDSSPRSQDQPATLSPNRFSVLDNVDDDIKHNLEEAVEEITSQIDNLNKLLPRSEKSSKKVTFTDRQTRSKTQTKAAHCSSSTYQYGC